MPTMDFMDTNLDQRPQRGTRGPYRRHTIAFKRAVVEQSLQPGASVSRLARLHDINANQIFAWRKAYQEGRLGVSARQTRLASLLRRRRSAASVRQQLPNPAVGLRRQLFEHVLQMREGLVAVEPRGLNQAHDRKGTLARPQAPREQPVLSIMPTFA